MWGIIVPKALGSGGIPVAGIPSGEQKQVLFPGHAY